MKMNQLSSTGKQVSGGEWVRSVGHVAFPNMVVVLPMMMPPSDQGDTEVNWWESSLKVKNHCNVGLRLL